MEMCKPAFKVRHGIFYRLLVFSLDRFLRRTLLRLRKETKIVIPLRNTAERNISMFLQDLPFWYVEYFRKYGRENNKEEGSDLLKKIFLSEFPHDACDQWFYCEFSRTTSISLDEIDFDKHEGIGYASKEKYKCIFIHHDLLSECYVLDALYDFCGAEVSLSDSNRGSRKWYSSGYKDFLSDGSFLEEYSRRLNESKVLDKFY